MNKRILIAAGGTGGHIFPGLAVADVLRAQGWTVEWLGAVGGLEEELVPKRGIPLHCLPITGARGKSLLTRVLTPIRVLGSVWRAHALLRTFSPDVVLGMGGYASGPGGLAAWLWRTPLIVHEQNAVPGLTNRVLSLVATQALAGFPGTRGVDRVVGNPVRESLFAVPSPAQRYPDRDGALRVLVIGGSRGAQALNTVMPDAVAQCDEIMRPVVWHQTGRGHADAVRAAYVAQGLTPDADDAGADAGAGPVLRVSEFIDDMAAAYAWADVVICRAGALTVSEIAAAGVAAVFVPYPHAVDDHQTRNAEVLVKQKAAWLLPQTELSAASLMAGWQRVQANRDELLRVASAAHALAQPDAARRVADVISEVAGERHG